MKFLIVTMIALGVLNSNAAVSSQYKQTKAWSIDTDLAEYQEWVTTSQDGKKWCYMSYLSEQSVFDPYKIECFSLSTGKRVSLVELKKDDFNFSELRYFSPNLDFLAFDTKEQLGVLNLKTGAVQLTKLPAECVSRLSFHRDGNGITFTGNGNDFSYICKHSDTKTFLVYGIDEVGKIKKNFENTYQSVYSITNNSVYGRFGTRRAQFHVLDGEVFDTHSLKSVYTIPKGFYSSPYGVGSHNTTLGFLTLSLYYKAEKGSKAVNLSLIPNPEDPTTRMAVPLPGVVGNDGLAFIGDTRGYYFDVLTNEINLFTSNISFVTKFNKDLSDNEYVVTNDRTHICQLVPLRVNNVEGQIYCASLDSSNLEFKQIVSDSSAIVQSNGLVFSFTESERHWGVAYDIDSIFNLKTGEQLFKNNGKLSDYILLPNDDFLMVDYEKHEVQLWSNR